MWIRVIVDALVAVFAAACVIAALSVCTDVVFYPERLNENSFCLFIQRIINKNREERK